MTKTLSVLSALVLLSFTHVDAVRAQGAQPGARPSVQINAIVELPDVPEDPEPAVRTGPAMRLGTAVGYAVFNRTRVNTLGGTLTAAWQTGRFAIEADYGFYRLHEQVTTDEYSGSVELGRFHRAGITGRVDFLSLGRDLVGENTKLVFWGEAGVGSQRGYFHTGERFRRNDAVVGFGWLLDHRLKKPLGFPSRVGWHFGWRLVHTGAPKTTYVAMATCKSPLCGSPGRDYDLGLLVNSGMHFSW